MQSQQVSSWVPVAISGDLPAGVAMPVLMPDGQLALWRSQTGRLAAFADRCPHRGMRLSHGFVRDEALSCIYHGWSYALGGNCLRIPAHPSLVPPAAIRVATYSVQEVSGIIWIAVKKPVGQPPSLRGLIPLRSLTAQSSLTAVQAAAKRKTNTFGLDSDESGQAAIRLLFAEQGEAQTLIHVLVPEDWDLTARIAASRAAEALRRTAEAIQDERIAA